MGFFSKARTALFYGTEGVCKTLIDFYLLAFLVIICRTRSPLKMVVVPFTGPLIAYPIP
jgi:hypothetical protein